MSLTQIKNNDLVKFYDDEEIIVNDYSDFSMVHHQKNNIDLVYDKKYTNKKTGAYSVYDSNTGADKHYQYKKSAEKAYRKLVESYEIKEVEEYQSYLHNSDVEIIGLNDNKVIVNYYAQMMETKDYQPLRRQLQALRSRDVFLLNAESVQWLVSGLIVNNKIIFIPKEIINYDHLNKFLDKFETVEVLFQDIELKINREFVSVNSTDTQVYLVHNTEHEFNLARKVFFRLVQNKKDHDDLRDLMFFEQETCPICDLSEDDCECVIEWPELEICSNDNCMCGKLEKNIINEDDETLADAECSYCSEDCDCDEPF